MNNTTSATKLLEAMAEQETEKRHTQEINDDSEIKTWLLGLAPLTDEQIYNAAWVN